MSGKKEGHGALLFCYYTRCFFVLLLYIWCFFVLHTVLFRFAPTHGAFSLYTVLFRFNEKAPWQRRFLPGNRLRPFTTHGARGASRCSRCFFGTPCINIDELIPKK